MSVVVIGFKSGLCIHRPRTAHSKHQQVPFGRADEAKVAAPLRLARRRAPGVMGWRNPK